jgi:hypothetical protein
MRGSSIFYPPRRAGNVFQGAVLGLLVCLLLVLIFLLTQLPVTLREVALATCVLLAFICIPFFLYRIVALNAARYRIDDRALELVWGMRREVVPLTLIQFILPEAELNQAIPKPLIRIPGSVTGKREVSGTRIDFFASSSIGMLLIDCQEKYIVINPSDPDAFLEEFQRVSETVNPNPVPAQSIYPHTFFQKVWRHREARLLAVINFLAWIILVGVSAWMFLQNNLVLESGNYTQANQLFLIPLLGSAVFLINLIFGSLLYNMPGRRYMAYLVWIWGVFTSGLFITGLLFIMP